MLFRSVLESGVLDPSEESFHLLYSTTHCRLIKKWDRTGHGRGAVENESKAGKTSNNENNEYMKPMSQLTRSAGPKACSPLHSSEMFTATESVFLQWALGMSPSSYLSSFSPWTSPNGRMTVEVLCVDPCVGDLKECMHAFHAESALTTHPNMNAKRYVKKNRVRAVTVSNTSTSNSNSSADRGVQDKIAIKPYRRLKEERVRIVVMLGGGDKSCFGSIIPESSGSASPFYRPENPLFDSNILESGLGSVFRGDMGMAYDFQVGSVYVIFVMDSFGDSVVYLLCA